MTAVFPFDFAAVLSPESVKNLADGINVAPIEEARRRLLADDRAISSLPGGKGKYDDQTVGLAARGSKNHINCLRLMVLARMFGAPAVCELGTNLGVSSAYLATGAGAPIRVRTGDISGARLALARTVHDGLGLTNVDYVCGDFVHTLESLLPKEIGLCFIDGDHTYEGTRRYFERVRVRMKPHGIIVFDDIDWSDGMRQAWNEISQDPSLAAVATIDGVGYVQVQ